MLNPANADPTVAAPSRRLLRWIGAFVGLALLAGAIAAVVVQRDSISQAMQSIRMVSPANIVLLLSCVVANIFLSGVMFWALTNRYGRVTFMEMQALTAGVSLVNFLPLRPGLLGRVAYHRAFNSIRTRDALLVVIHASLISVAIAAYLIFAALLLRWLNGNLFIGVAAPILPLAGACLFTRIRPLAVATLARYLELMIWIVRYRTAFMLIGSPIELEAAVAIACVSVIAGMVPFVSNGLGLREWAVGLLAPFLTSYTLELGITAELVNRAAEIAVIVVVGLIGLSALAHRRRAVRRVGD